MIDGFPESAPDAILDLHGSRAEAGIAPLLDHRLASRIGPRLFRKSGDRKQSARSAERFPLRQKSSTTAVLGAGHGGLALAAYLAQQGHRVSLWNRSPDRVAPVAELGGVWLSRAEESSTLARVATATVNMRAALAGANRVLVAVPASGHADVARKCAPYLRDGQTVLLLPGRTGGALEFRRTLLEAGCRADILLGEASTFPVAARCVGPAAAHIFGAKAEVLAAALPARRTPELLAAWQPVLPMLTGARSVLHTGTSNFGAILHPTITLLNAARIRRGEAFDFYSEGVTPRVAAVLAGADAERLSIARAYGVPCTSLPEWIASSYGHCADTMQAAVADNPAYVGIKAPVTLEHRYLLEDVPTGLIPLAELGEAAGVAVPTLRGLVGLARDILGGEAWQRPRTLAALGLAGLRAAEIGARIEDDWQPIHRRGARVETAAYRRSATALELLPRILTAG